MKNCYWSCRAVSAGPDKTALLKVWETLLTKESKKEDLCYPWERFLDKRQKESSRMLSLNPKASVCEGMRLYQGPEGLKTTFFSRRPVHFSIRRFKTTLYIHYKSMAEEENAVTGLAGLNACRILKLFQNITLSSE